MRLQQKGVNLEQVALLVFNDKASIDIKNKLNQKGIYPLPKVYTFHAIALKLYKFLQRKGLLPDYQLNTSEAYINSIASRILNKAKTEKEKTTSYASKDELDTFISFIDLAKTTLKPPSETYKEYIKKSEYEYFINAFEAFEEERIKRKILTFSDLIKEVVSVCHNNEMAMSFVKGHLDYLILDEFQDINEIMIDLSKILSSDTTKWAIFGDVDQCIYSWRGARPEYLAYKIKEYLVQNMEVKEYSLPETFRYGHHVSVVSNNVKNNNTQKTEDLCISSPTTPESKIHTHNYETEGRFGEVTATQVKKEIAAGMRPQDIAILIRLNSFSVEIELALLNAGIAFNSSRKQSLFDQAEISALITLIEIQNDLFNLNEIDVMCHKFNALMKLCFCGQKIEMNNTQAEQVKLSAITLHELILNFNNEKLSKFKKKHIDKIASAIKAIDSQKANTIRPETVLTTFFESCNCESLINLFTTTQEQADNRIYTVQSFIEYIKNQKSNSDEILDHIAALRDQNKSEIDCVNILTPFKAKGLEWKSVYIVGLEDGLFPYTRKDNTDMEGERRLFYVATTRCITDLHYVHIVDDELEKQLSNTTSESCTSAPKASRFLYEAKIHSSTSNTYPNYQKHKKSKYEHINNYTKALKQLTKNNTAHS